MPSKGFTVFTHPSIPVAWLDQIKHLGGSSFVSIADDLKPSTVFTKTLRLVYSFALAMQLFTF